MKRLLLCFVMLLPTTDAANRSWEIRIAAVVSTPGKAQLVVKIGVVEWLFAAERHESTDSLGPIGEERK